MDYKEKLRLAKEALDSGSYDKDTIEYSFPELAESEEERMKKELLNAFKEATDSLYMVLTPLKREAFIAWLEKQGEQKSAEWSDKDYVMQRAALKIIMASPKLVASTILKESVIVWFQSLKDRLQPQRKQEWSEEDENLLKLSLENLTELKDRFGEEYGKVGDCIVWHESIKDRIQHQTSWKPSEEMLEALYRAIPENVMEISEDEMLLDKLYQGLKYGRELSNK